MRDAIRSLIVYATVAACFFAAPVYAGSLVYACKTKDGTTYQDHPCATADATLGAKNVYAPQPCGSSCGVENGNSWQSQLDDGDAQGRGFVEQPEQVAVETTQTPSGFQCSGNGKTWIQAKPCPDSITVHRPVSVSGFDQYGNHITAHGTMRDSASVDQRGLTHEQMCEQVNNRTPTKSHGKDGPSDAYERNKIRQQEGC